MSTEVMEEDMPCRAHVLVSEMLGTLMLGEGALDYLEDARERLLQPNAKLVPHSGKQYATLIQSTDLQSISSIKRWRGIDLGAFNVVQDTSSVVSTKVLGFRFSSIQ